MYYRRALTVLTVIIFASLAIFLFRMHHCHLLSETGYSEQDSLYVELDSLHKELSFIYRVIDSLTADYLNQIEIITKSRAVECSANQVKLQFLYTENLKYTVMMDHYSEVNLKLKDDLIITRAERDHFISKADSMVTPAAVREITDSLLLLIEEKKQLHDQRADTLTFTTSANFKVMYFGGLINRKANGRGTGLWQDGGYYFGEWKDNKRHGRGLFLWSNGDIYQGEYFNDLREGTGSYYWNNGNYYSGEWKNNERSGSGILYDSEGRVKYQGYWAADIPARGF